MIGLVEKVYHRYVGEHGQRQRHLRVPSGHDHTELGYVGRHGE